MHWNLFSDSAHARPVTSIWVIVCSTNTKYTNYHREQIKSDLFQIKSQKYAEWRVGVSLWVLRPGVGVGVWSAQTQSLMSARTQFFVPTLAMTGSVYIFWLVSRAVDCTKTHTQIRPDEG